MKQVKAILLSVGIMAAVSGALLALFALILSKTGSLPRGAIPTLTTVIGCAAVLLGGFCASLFVKEKGFLFGICGGLLFAVCIALVSFFALQNEFSIAGAGKIAAILISGSLGGILGVNRKSRVKF